MNVRLRQVWFFLVALVAFGMPLLAGADDTGCPAQMKPLNEPQCGDSQACTDCKAAVKKEKDGSAKKYDAKRETCRDKQDSCKGKINQISVDAGRPLRFLSWLDSIACNPAFALQKDTMQDGKGVDDKGQKCFNDAAASSAGAAGEANGCASSIRGACKGDAQQAGEKEAKKCEDAGKDAQKTADQNKKKADEAGKQAAKNGDNAKKEGGGGGGDDKKGGDDAKKEGGGGGGGPPPPPPPGGGDDKPPPENPAQYPQNDSGLTQNTDTNTTPAEETTSKLDEERFPSGSTFGADNAAAGSKDSVAPATAAIGAAGMPGWHGGSGGFNPSTDSGGGSPMNTSGASMMGSGVGGGGGGSGNSLDKATSAADLPKPEPGNNPYEINGSGGGRLGAPKGSKSGGESDSTLDASAASSFSSDVAISTDKATGGEAAPEEDPDAGFTLFKMVKYRYSELKRSGHI